MAVGRPCCRRMAFFPTVRLSNASAGTRSRPAVLPEKSACSLRKGPDHIICDLALSFAGKELVPLPEFFSDAQLAHIVKAAHLTHAVADQASANRAKLLGLTVLRLAVESSPNAAPASDAGRNHLHPRDHRQAEGCVLIWEPTAC